MKLSAGILSLALALGVNAAGEWQQCAGKEFGTDACTTGLVCVFINEYYSQCQRGVASTTVVPTSSARPPATSTVPSVTSTRAPVTSSAAPPTPTGIIGFVGVSGTKFTLNGKPFSVIGTNSYWVGLNNLSAGDKNIAFRDIAASGATTVRTWGFSEVLTTSQQPNYYQIWNGATPTINYGPLGLESFDGVVAAAKANGIRLIVALTNNWTDYGGSNVYVRQILGSANHDLFYTDAKVIAAFKAYIAAFVGRYANDPTILGWELANEPRCRGSTGISTGTCTPATITAWAKNISAYIKSIDKNHLVALGDEGFYNQPNGPNYPYQGGEGIDFDVNLGISTLDFGTFHAYPEHWGQEADATNWMVQWVKDHAASQTRANKPVIMEEYGLLTPGRVRTTEYKTIWSAVESSGLTGDLYWQAGSKFAWGSSHNDGYAFYPGDPEFEAIKVHNAAIKARDGSA